jgi:hypothetical protein
VKLSRRFGWTCAVVLLQFVAIFPARADTGDAIACERAAQAAEAEFGLPAGVLRAIGKVESRGWPWTANVDGAAEIYQSKSEAVAGLTRVRPSTPANIDVGCFQISSRYHPLAFATVADALDPDANAHYAARFLTELRTKYGDWARAVGAYHSATPPLEAAYRDQVMANWKDGDPRPAAVAGDQPRWRVIPIGTTVQSTLAVWSMSAIPVNTGALPRVITR